MPRHFFHVALWMMPIIAVAQTAAAQQAGELDARTVNLAIDRAVGYLISTQDKETHAWQDHPGQPGGLTALCCLALMNAGLPAGDEKVRPALDHLTTLGRPTM